MYPTVSEVISDAVFAANHLTDTEENTDKHNSIPVNHRHQFIVLLLLSLLPHKVNVNSKKYTHENLCETINVDTTHKTYRRHSKLKNIQEIVLKLRC